MAIDQNALKPYLDASQLYCHEEEEDSVASVITSSDTIINGGSLFPQLLLLQEQDLFWEDQDLKSLFNKEEEECMTSVEETTALMMSQQISLPRQQAVQWILKITSHYAFSSLTPILAVSYLNRFLINNNNKDDKKKQPWMIHLAAVACLSLAAKLEETHVPLLLDLQVEEAEYVFEAKTIQRMELLVLSSVLKWRTNTVTPFSFIHHIVRRLGLKTYAHWDFLNSCQNLILSVIHDSRLMVYLPSVMATATMLHVINQVEPCNASAYQNQLLSVLKINKEEVNVCYEALSDISSNTSCVQINSGHSLKRNLCQIQTSPDSSFCISSSTHFKKTRVDEEQGIRLLSSRVFVTANPN